MRIIITGVPGTGKTCIAKKLGKKIKAKVINELEFARKKRIGKREGKERVIPLKQFEKSLNKEVKKFRNAIIEGHLLCEIKLKADKLILLRAKPEEIEKRLRKKGYKEEKILDNVFCEETGYIKEKLLKNYPKNKIIEIKSEKNINNTLNNIIKKLKIEGIK